MHRVAVIALAVLFVAGCGGDPDDAGQAAPEPTTTVPPTSTSTSTTSTSTTTTSTTTAPIDDWPAEPPPVVFESADDPIERPPFTVCWSEPRSADPDQETQAWCADGVPEDPSPTVVPIDGRVAFTFDVTGWAFSARFMADGASIPVDQTGPTTWELAVPAEVPADIVIVSGFGPPGDVHVSIQLPATRDGEALGGDAVPVEVRDHCAIGIAVIIGDEWFLLSGPLAGLAPGAGFPWERSDFPTDWNVEIMNDQPVDGDGFAIRDAEAIRIDDTTLEVRHIGTRDPIGTFVLDTRSPGDRVFCG